MEIRKISLTGLLALALLTGGCAESMQSANAPSKGASDVREGENEDDSRRDESFLERAEEMGMTPQDTRTKAILLLANEASLEKLDSSAEVGLDVRAAEHIVAYRHGADRQAGTGDDRTFETLEELDSVKWVGTRAFGKLYDYAMANGYDERVSEPEPSGEPVHGVTPGSAEAEGILRVANTASQTELDESDYVGLDARAAQNIVDFRLGEDGAPGTADDAQFATLVELDDISYVADRAFGKLLAYAERKGYVGESDPQPQQPEPPIVNDYEVAESGSSTTLVLKHELARAVQNYLPEMSATQRARFSCASDGEPTCSFAVRSVQPGHSYDRELITFTDETSDTATSALVAATGSGFTLPIHCYTISSPPIYGGGSSAECIVYEQSVITLEAGDAALPEVGPDYRWEGWLIEDGKPVSTDLFDARDGITDYHFAVADRTLEDASAFVLTIEPADEAAGTPSASKYLGGAVSDQINELRTTFGPTVSGADLTGAQGSFFLAAPSADAASGATYRNGIWFIDASGTAPAASLDLPELGDGWTYEGWVVKPGEGPVSTGRFDSPSGADSDFGGPFAGPNSTPPFPGQDFVTGAERRDLTDGYRVVISVEPQPDDSPAPFAIKPLVGDIADAGAKTAQSLQYNDAGVPEATLRIR